VVLVGIAVSASVCDGLLPAGVSWPYATLDAAATLAHQGQSFPHDLNSIVMGTSKNGDIRRIMRI
jgi:hypothetical protein